MARTHQTLTSLFSDIADSIRTKTGSSADLKADNFPTAILSIPTGIDTSDATAYSGDIANGKTAYARGNKLTGSAVMANGSYANNTIGLTDGFPVDIGGGSITVVSLDVNKNGTYTAPSGEAYSPVNVNVPTGTQRSASDVTVSGKTVTVPSGLYSSQVQKSVSDGSVSNPTASKGSVTNHQISVTPSVTSTTGYITGGTKSGTAVTVSASELVSGSETKTSNGTYDVTNLAQLVVNVASSSGPKIYYSNKVVKTTNKSSYSTTGVSVTVGEAGTYKCSWFYYAGSSSSATSYGTRIYVGSSSKGSEHTGAYYSGSSGWNCTENSISATAGQTIEVRAKTRSGSSYFTVCGMLIVEKVS